MDLPTPLPSNNEAEPIRWPQVQDVCCRHNWICGRCAWKILSDELDIDTSCLTFWREHPKYGRLALNALRALSVHASSAPVERVFSHGGISVRPHRGPGCQKQQCQHWCFLNATVCKLTQLFWLSHCTYCCISELPVLRQHCHDIGLATYVDTLNGELFQLVITLILICLYLGLGLDSSGLGLGLRLGTCWTRYRSGKHPISDRWD